MVSEPFVAWILYLLTFPSANKSLYDSDEEVNPAKDELDPHSLATGIHLSKKIESGVAFVAQEKV